MTEIWKYTLGASDTLYIRMPQNAHALSVAVQKEIPCLWVIVHPENELQPVRVKVLMTGQKFQLDTLDTFVGTYQLFDGDLIYHVFFNAYP